MPTQTTTRRPAAAAKRAHKDVDGLDRIGESLESVQKSLGAMRGHMRTGAEDIGKDVDRMVKDARRDLTKLARALRRDVDDLQVAVSGEKKPAPRRRAATGKTASRPKTKAATR